MQCRVKNILIVFVIPSIMMFLFINRQKKQNVRSGKSPGSFNSDHNFNIYFRSFDSLFLKLKYCNNDRVQTRLAEVLEAIRRGSVPKSEIVEPSPPHSPSPLFCFQGGGHD